MDGDVSRSGFFGGDVERSGVTKADLGNIRTSAGLGRCWQAQVKESLRPGGSIKRASAQLAGQVLAITGEREPTSREKHLESIGTQRLKTTRLCRRWQPKVKERSRSIRNISCAGQCLATRS